MANETMARLVEAAKQGDEHAVEELYWAHSPRIYHLCLRMAGNKAEAEDLTQEIFLQAFRKLHTFQGEAAYSTWLYRVGVNAVLMKLRKRSHAEVSLDAVAHLSGETPRNGEPAAKHDPAETMVNRLALRGALGQLPSRYKEVFLMHDVEGYTHHEIAQATGRTVGTSKSLLHRAHHRLRELVAGRSGVRATHGPTEHAAR